MHTETSLLLCHTDEKTYEELIGQTNVMGTPDQFVIHMSDFYSLHDDLKMCITYTSLYTK